MALGNSALNNGILKHWRFGSRRYRIVPTVRHRTLNERGIVKWFNAAGGYGFIRRPTGVDVFVSAPALHVTESGLHQGEQVEYSVSDGPKGIHVESVRKLFTSP